MRVGGREGKEGEMREEKVDERMEWRDEERGGKEGEIEEKGGRKSREEERKREWRERVSEGGWNKLITKYIITLDSLHCWRSTW